MSNKETIEKLSSAVANIDAAMVDLQSMRAIDSTITESLRIMEELQMQLTHLRNDCIDNDYSL